MTLTNYWALTTSEQNQIRDTHPTTPLLTYRVEGLLNMQLSMPVNEVVQAYSKYDAIERVEKGIIHTTFSTPRLSELRQRHKVIPTWLNYEAHVEILIKSNDGDYWIEE